MFNLSIKEVVLSIEKSSLVNLNGIVYQEYQNFFGDGFHIPDLAGRKFDLLENQDDLPRRKLNYSDEISKKLKVFFMHSAITKALETKFDTALKFESVDIWVDDAGYVMQPHVDDSSIKLALQIYLGNDNVGTSLYTNGTPTKTFPFRENCGYALLNNHNSLHGLDRKVTKDGRISLYARYS